MQKLSENFWTIVAGVFCLTVLLGVKDASKEIGAAILWPIGILWNGFADHELYLRKYMLSLQLECLLFLVIGTLLCGWLGFLVVYIFFSILALTATQTTFKRKLSWRK